MGTNPRARHLRARGAAMLVTPGIALLARPAAAGPPFVTDDPEPVEVGHGEFHIANRACATATAGAAHSPTSGSTMGRSRM